jgi:hypothetical protein
MNTTELKYDFSRKAIDVRDCTPDQKRAIHDLIVKRFGRKQINESLEMVGFLYADEIRLEYNDENGIGYNKRNGYTEVHYKDFLREINPYKGKWIYITEADDEVRHRVYNELGYNKTHTSKRLMAIGLEINHNAFEYSHRDFPTDIIIITKEQFMLMELPLKDNEPLFKEGDRVILTDISQIKAFGS